MRLGAIRTLEDVQRELSLLSVVRIRHEYLSWEYATPISTSSSSFGKYGPAVFSVETEAGDTVEFDYFVECSAGTTGGLVSTRISRGAQGRGLVRRGRVSGSYTSGIDLTIHSKVRDTPPPGKNEYTLQWAVTGAATAYSAGAELFITVYSSVG